MSCHGHQHQFGGVEHVHRAGPFFRADNQLAKARAAVGSNLEGLTYYHDGLTTLKNNLSAANSRVTDVDDAQESTSYAKYNILVQSGTALLGQANVRMCRQCMC
jgi:flagellin-like hook-associated protein FlgL